MNGRFPLFVAIAAALAVAGVFVIANAADDSSADDAQFTLTVSTQPHNGGWVEQHTATINGVEYTGVYAEPGEGFHFVRWTENGTTVSADALYMFQLTGDRALTAVFEEGDMMYVISVSSADPQMGSVSGGGSFRSHQQVTVNAAPNEGYRFVMWTEDGAETSNEASYMFYVSGARALTAVFEPIVYSVHIAGAEHGTGAADPAEATIGTTVSLSATPDQGYALKEWSVVSGGPVSVNADGTFTMPPRDITITPVFEKIYNVIIGDVEGGKVTATPASGITGTEITLTYEATKGWKFKEWVAPKSVEIVDDKFTIPEADVTISAVFDKIVYTVTIGTENVVGGSAVAEPPQATMGETVTITATAEDGYRFSEWVIDADDEEVVIEENGTFAMPAANVTATPVFVKTYVITFVDYDGTVIAQSAIDENAIITAPADPTRAPTVDKTFVFVGWEGFTAGVTTAVADATYAAVYEDSVTMYTISFVHEESGYNVTYTAAYGNAVVLPDSEPEKSGYSFDGWLEYEEGMTVTGNMTFHADFSANPSGLGDEAVTAIVAVIAIIVIAIIGVLLLAHYEVISVGRKI